ncbi:MAG: phospholipase [Bacteroidales bacterium]|nr:phospholipase [Bacteroidales bacterium]
MRNKLIYFVILFLGVNSISAQDDNSKLKIKCNYLLYLPQNYENQTDTFPLIIYLHGGSMRGDNLEKLKTYGLPKLIENGNQYNFIIASPQCPENTYWSRINWFDTLYQELNSIYRIDKKRIFVTGISAGGFGAWHAAMDNPDRISAIIPLCGGCNDSLEICKINHIPIWTFHGTKDNLIDINETERLVRRLKTCNGNVKFTRLDSTGHNIRHIYENQEIYDWFLKQNIK